MPVPSRSYQTDAGIDLTAMSVEQKSHGVFLFDSGISIQISDGYYVEIVPRSSIIKTEKIPLVLRKILIFYLNFCQLCKN